MIISHSNRFIFLHNPKCAGTSFRNALNSYHDDAFTYWGIFDSSYFRNKLDHTHLRLWELLAHRPDVYSCFDTYNSMIFVRNPFLRFLSAVSEHMKKFQPNIDLTLMSGDERIAFIEEFIRYQLHPSRIITDWKFIHFSPQIWYLKLGHRQVPRHIIPMVDDDGFLHCGLNALGLPDLPVPRYNVSAIDLKPVLRSPAIVKFIRDFYADDFAFFQANTALVALTADISV